MNKNVTKRILTAVFFLIFSSAGVLAQYYDIGSEKPSVGWRKMRSKNFEIIYPAGKSASASGEAARSYIEQVEASYGIYADSVRYTYGLPKRFPLVLHMFNAQSNGITVWAPRQIDFYTQPPVDAISSEPWDLSLATHEGRHAWQIAHFNRGFLKILYWALGDQIIGGASGIYPSAWMLEGDAVVAETQMSGGGRGRNGFFLQNTLRSITPPSGESTFYGKDKSWDRWRFGSVKAFSPSKYDVGYMINATARHHSGDVDLTHKILNYEALHLLSANVVASAFKEYTGKTHRQYIQGSLLQEYASLNTNAPMKEFMNRIKDSAGSSEDGNAAPSEARQAGRTGAKQGYYTEYHHITSVGKDSLAAIVAGYGTPGSLVLLYLCKDNDGGSFWKEKVLRPFDSAAERLFCFGGRIYWSELNADPRWGQHSEYAVFSYDLKTGQTREYGNAGHLPQGARTDEEEVLFALNYPAYRQLGQGQTSEIAAFAGNGNSRKQPLVLRTAGQITSYAINSSSGHKGQGYEIFYTLINEKGLGLYCNVITSEDGKTSASEDGKTPASESGSAFEVQEIMPPSAHLIKDLTMYNGDLFFITDRFGSPVLCRMEPSPGGKLRLASAFEDVSSFCIAEDGTLYVVKACADRGMFPFADRMTDVEIPDSLEFNYPLAEELTRQYQEKYGRTVEAYRQKLTESISLSDEPYGKAAGLFRIHSWAPVYASYSGATSGDFESFYSEGLPGATVYSQNTLGTMRASAGYAFQHRSGYLGTSKNLHSGHATLAWSGWYPVFEGSAHFNDRIMYKSGRFSLRTALSAYVPLSWSRGGWLSGVTPVVSWSFRNDQIVLESVTEKGKSTADDDSDEEPTYAYTLSQVRRHQVNFAVGAYRSVPVAKAQVYPRWGIGGRLKASVSPSGGSNFGSEASAYIYAYLPGLTFNQGLRLSASYQRQMASGKKYWLDNHLELPRGFTEDFYGRNMVRLTADYAIPAYLGDVSLGPIAYLQQLQVIPFVDYGKTDFLRKLGTGTSASTHFVWEDRYSFGADVMVKGHFLRIGFPMYLGVRYARTNKPCNLGNAAPEAYAGSGNRNFVSLLFGVTIY